MKIQGGDRMNRYLQTAILLGTATLAFCAENKRSRESLKTEYYKISSSKIPEVFHHKKLVFLSDLHNVELGKDNERLLNAIHKEMPDYILVGGDMLVSKASNHSEQAIKFMQNLARCYPVYCGNGNHEERLLWRAEECPEAGEIYKNYVKALKECGVHYICDETIRIEEQGSYLYISGLEISEEYYAKFQHSSMPVSYISKHLGDCKQDSFHILLAHNPCYFETYASWGADLTLSGHLHGGIVRLPYLGGVIAPSYQLFPKYDAGLFQKGEKKMIVSVGLGSHSIKVRLLNPPKIDVITLEREERINEYESD